VERQGLPQHPRAQHLQNPDNRRLPEHLKIDLWPAPNREDNVFGSKALGEPLLMLAISVYEAIKDAIAAAQGDKKTVQLTAPATAENVLMALRGGKPQRPFLL
jgi:xanthine dehydrogenase large subunit